MSPLDVALDEGERSASMSSPDLIEHIVGFRAWRLVGGALAPIGAGIDTWDGGNEIRAVCGVADRFRARTGVVAYMPAGRRPRPDFAWHVAPQAACNCGIYAWHDVHDVTPGRASTARVVGAVAARGIVEAHEHGFRAQFARPVLFAYADGDDPAAVLALGRRFGVDVCPYGELGARALAFGKPVPEILRPHACTCCGRGRHP